MKMVDSTNEDAQQTLCEKVVTSTKKKVKNEDEVLGKYVVFNDAIGADKKYATDANCYDLKAGRDTPKIRFSDIPGYGITANSMRGTDETGKDKVSSIGNAKDFIYGRNKFDLKNYVKKKALEKKEEVEKAQRKRQEDEEVERMRQEEEEKYYANMQEKENRHRQNAAAFAKKESRIYGGTKHTKKTRKRKTKKYNIKK